MEKKAILILGLLLVAGLATLGIIRGTGERKEFDRFLKLAQGQSAQRILADDKDEKEAPSALQLLKYVIGNMTGSWNDIVSSFKTETKTELKQVLSERGFSYFSQKSQVKSTFGIEANSFPRYTEMLLKRINLPENHKSQISEELTFSESSRWKLYETVFSMDSGGNCKFIAIMGNRDQKKNVFNVVYTNMEASFKLAPDIMIIQESTSILGGLYSESRVRLQELPRGLKIEELKSIFDFFTIVAFKSLADEFGVPAALPQLN